MGRIVFLALCLMLMATVSYAGTTEIISVDSSGNQTANMSYYPAVNCDGRYIAFQSYDGGLVTGDTNGAYDIFVHDRMIGTTERISVDSYGNQADVGGLVPSISSDGRFVAFFSWATNLVPLDTNWVSDVFIHDRATGITERISVDSYGNQRHDDSTYPSINCDGRYISYVFAWRHIFVYDRLTGMTETISVDSNGIPADGRSYSPVINCDGRYIAFQSDAGNLALGDTNGVSDVFVHDRATGITERVSVDSNGIQATSGSADPAISYDGRYVAFVSYASNLTSSDTNGASDVFVHDRATGITERVSIDSNGNHANGDSYGPSISSDSRYIVFVSSANNLAPNDTNGLPDIFIHDRATGITERVSVDSNGIQATSGSADPAISYDGRYVAFSSVANTLVLGDNNGSADIFIRDRGPNLPATINDIISSIQQMLGAGDIDNQGIATSLTSILENALSELALGNIQDVKNMLQAFINKVSAQAGKHITEETAIILIEATRQIIETI